MRPSDSVVLTLLRPPIVPRRSGRPKDRGAPNFAARKELSRARAFLLRAAKSAPPRPLRGASVLDPSRSARCARPVFETKEGTMITLQDHIDELRAELRGCLTRRERAKVAADLEAAIADLKERGRAGEAYPPTGRRESTTQVPTGRPAPA